MRIPNTSCHVSVGKLWNTIQKHTESPLVLAIVDISGNGVSTYVDVALNQTHCVPDMRQSGVKIPPVLVNVVAPVAPSIRGPEFQKE